MAWFVVQEKGKRAQMVIDRKLLDVIYGAPAEVTVKGFHSYETAKCAAMVADAELDVANTKLGIRLCKADVKRATKALEDAVANTKLGIRLCKADVKRAAKALKDAVQAHQTAPTEQTLDAVKMASAAHEAECTELRVRNKTLRALARK